MPASLKSLREAPPRIFDDYILTYEYSNESGLFPVSNKEMSYVPGDAGNPFYSGHIDRNAIFDIGFNFEFNSIVYNQIYVHENGFAVLVDPILGYDKSYLFDLGQEINTAINVDFSSNNVLLAPWFAKLTNTNRNIEDYNTKNWIAAFPSVGTYQDIIQGKVKFPEGINSTTGGIKYIVTKTHELGRCLVIRWNSFSYWLADPSRTSILAFDLVLFENGRIEFRYNKKKDLHPHNSWTAELATVGIFMNNGSYRYRDFGSELKKDKTRFSFQLPRSKNKNGGSVYNGTFVDFDILPDGTYVGGYSWTTTLSPIDHWPGQNIFGAVFRFMPPNIKKKFTKIDVAKNSSKNFFQKDSIFNDEKTIFTEVFTNLYTPYGRERVTVNTSMPSGIPVDKVINSHHPNSHLDAWLNSSGSIEISCTGSIKLGKFDNILLSQQTETFEQDPFKEINLYDQEGISLFIPKETTHYFITKTVNELTSSSPDFLKQVVEKSDVLKNSPGDLQKFQAEQSPQLVLQNFQALQKNEIYKQQLDFAAGQIAYNKSKNTNFNPSDNKFFSKSALESSTGTDPRSFASSLQSKIRFNVTLPVNNKIQMLGSTSSIYYFNVENKQWNIPAGAIGDIAGPFNKLCHNTQFIDVDYGNYSGSNIGSKFFEDHVGFNPLGFPVISGNLDLHRLDTGLVANEYVQSEANFGTQTATRDKHINLLTGDFPKSIQRNTNYAASREETFTLSNQHPFLIEKVIVEVPFCLGDSWFRDRTTSTILLNSASIPGNLGYPHARAEYFDFGGPGITLSLFSQKNYGTSSIRDLIASNFVTNFDDTVFNLKPSYLYGQTVNFFYASSTGLNNVDLSTISVISSSEETKSFTGSIRFNLESNVTNGISTLMIKDVPSTLNDNMNSGLSAVKSFLESPYDGNNINYVTSADSYGRGMTGFAPSGGSIFGGEYATSQESIDQYTQGTKNPIYAAKANSRNRIYNSISSSLKNLYLSAAVGPGRYAINLIGTNQYRAKKTSPYLIYPGEKIVLAVSKTRPAFSSSVCQYSALNTDETKLGLGTLVSSSFFNDIRNPSGHDVQLNTGSISITVYGSYVKSGNGYSL